MTRRVRWRAGLSTALSLSLAVVVGGAGTSSAAAPATCRLLDLSPTFATDGTAFCADSGLTRYVVFRTTDRGRSWIRVGADSPWIPDGSAATQIVVSADFADDRTVYLATTSTIYVSTDAGASFFPADLLSGDGSGRRIFTAYSDATTGIAYVAAAHYQAPARLRPPAREPVEAALPAKTDRFLLPTRVTAGSDPVLLAFDGSGESLRSTVYACSARLDCTEARGSFQYTARVAWRSARYATDRSLYFVTDRNGFTFLRSTNGGRTITPFTSLNAALAPLRVIMAKSSGGFVLPAMTFGPNGRIYVRLATGIPDAGQPAQVLLRSDDAGKRWKRVGAQYLAESGRPSGNMPFEVLPNTMPENGAQIHAAPDGRLFAMGDGFGENDIGPWCSVDGGVRWYRTCPR